MGACTEIQRRVKEIQSSGKSEELRFNLLAVVGDQTERYTRATEYLKQKRQEFTAKLEASPESAEFQKEIDLCSNRIVQCDDMIQAAAGRRKDWAKENERRRHDFVPFLLCGLRHLAKTGELSSAFKVQEENNKKRAAAAPLPASTS
eukprot:Platyproteum_vivax@DN16096_c0_g1_i1.p1